MKQKEFTKRYAERMHLSSAEAADQIDRVVSDLLRRLRTGQPASLPGLGAIQPGAIKPLRRWDAMKGKR